MSHQKGMLNLSRRGLPWIIRDQAWSNWWGIFVCLLIGLLLALYPARATARPEPDLAAVDAFVEAQMQRHGIPGLALAITQDDHIIHLRGFGTAGPHRAMTPQTPLHIGSISKSFTALAVMQLVEAGQIDLDAPVQTYIPWFRVADPLHSAAITIRHLLHQTSGLSEATYMPDLPQDTTLSEGVRDLQRASPVALPGSTFHYFNQNYATLGLLVETVSGMSYGDYVTTQILAPLQMNDTAATLEGIGALDVAQGYGNLFGFPLPRTEARGAHQMPEGGIVSTAEDMAHYLIVHLNDGVYETTRILSAEGIAALHRPDTPGAPADEGYGMGWIIEQAQPAPATAAEWVIHHGGSMDNFRSFAVLRSEAGYGIIVLMNQNGFIPTMLAYSDIPNGIGHILVGREPETGLSMRFFYGGLTALTAVIVALDLRWWWRSLSRRRVAPSSRTRSVIGIAGSLARAIVCFGLPYALLRLLGRGFNWRLGFTMAPTISILLGWNVAMGALQSMARSWRQIAQARAKGGF